MKSRARLTLTLVCAVVGALFFTGWSVSWLSRGSYLTAVIMLGGGTFCATSVFLLAYALSGTPRPRTECGPDGTVIRPQRFVDLVAHIGIISAVLAAALYLVCAPLGMVDYQPTGVMRVTVPSGCVFIVVFGAPIVYRMFSRGESYLRLHPGGFEVWNGGWGIFKQAAWDELEEVLDRPARGRSIGRDMVVFVLPKHRSAMFVSDHITGHSHALREWVRFYWRHPEFRDELVDGRGLQRLDERRFTVS